MAERERDFCKPTEHNFKPMSTTIGKSPNGKTEQTTLVTSVFCSNCGGTKILR